MNVVHILLNILNKHVFYNITYTPHTLFTIFTLITRFYRKNEVYKGEIHSAYILENDILNHEGEIMATKKERLKKKHDKNKMKRKKAR